MWFPGETNEIQMNPVQWSFRRVKGIELRQQVDSVKMNLSALIDPPQDR